MEKSLKIKSVPVNFGTIVRHNGKQFQFQMDTVGNFRIAVIATLGAKVIASSNWTFYQGIAIFKYCNKTYIAISGYFENGIFPIETIVELKEGEKV